MPLIALQCPECGQTDDQFLHAWQDYGCALRWCACGSTMAPALSVGRGLTYFEEGRARVIENLGGVEIRSHRQHEQVMKARGVEMATDWHTSKRGEGVGRAMQTHPTPPPLRWEAP